jgi:hypothetical protein
LYAGLCTSLSHQSDVSMRRYGTLAPGSGCRPNALAIENTATANHNHNPTGPHR